MTTDQEIHCLLTARRFGGRFISLLAEAALAADPLNRGHLLLTFPEFEEMFGPRSIFYSEVLG